MIRSFCCSSLSPQPGYPMCSGGSRTPTHTPASALSSEPYWSRACAPPPAPAGPGSRGRAAAAAPIKCSFPSTSLRCLWRCQSCALLCALQRDRRPGWRGTTGDPRPGLGPMPGTPGDSRPSLGCLPPLPAPRPAAAARSDRPPPRARRPPRSARGSAGPEARAGHRERPAPCASPSSPAPGGAAASRPPPPADGPRPPRERG